MRCLAHFDDDFQAGNDAAIHLYRIVQESISNALRHGLPSEIRIEGRVKGGEMRLSVTDNGNGFQPDSKQHGSGLGLRLFQYRARLIGGQVKVMRANTHGGCRVECVFPRDHMPGPC